MRIAIDVAFLCWLLLSPGAQPSTLPAAYGVDEAYAVYSFLIPDEESFGIANGTLIIQQETVPKAADSDSCVTPDAARQFKEAIADYKRVNQKPWLLQRQFRIARPYEIVNSDTLSLVFKEGGWKGFYARYPNSGGYVIVSAVGFDKDKTMAVAYSGSSCGGLCGRWSLHLLRKSAGKWENAPGVTCLTVS